MVVEGSLCELHTIAIDWTQRRPATDDPGIIRAMSDRTTARGDARRLALARLISMAGNVAAGVALASVLWTRTHSSGWVAAGALSTSLVAGTITPLTGALADRRDRRKVMIASDLLAAGMFGLLALLIALHAHPGWLLATAALGAVCESPFVPASRAALPNLVDDEDLPWANGLLGQVAGLSFAVGPLVGGALTGLVSGAMAMGFNAATFLVSAALVRSIRRRFDRRHETPAPTRRGMVRAGIRYAWNERLLRAVIVSGFVAFIGVGFVIAANPAFADREGAGAVGLGALWAGWGVGTIAGATLAPRLLAPGREVPLAVGGFALQGVALATAAILPFWVVVVSQTIGGVGAGIADPSRHTLIQRTAPDAMRGRVVAVMEAAGWLSFAVSLTAAGTLVDRIGVRPSYAVAAALFAVGTTLMVVMSRGGRVHSAPPSEPEAETVPAG